MLRRRPEPLLPVEKKPFDYTTSQYPKCSECHRDSKYVLKLCDCWHTSIANPIPRSS